MPDQTPQPAPFSLTLPWGLTVYTEYDDNQPHLGIRDEDDGSYVQTALTPESMRIIATELTRMAGAEQPAAEQPAAEPEPCVITDVAGDTVRVSSLRGPFRIAVDTTDTTWLDPDQADQLADALKAHAAARRAERQGDRG